MKKTKPFIFLVVGLLLGGVLAFSIQLDITPKTINVSEEERVRLLTENWNLLPSPFTGTMQLGIYNVSELEVILETSPRAVPENLMVYEVIKPVVNEPFARKIRDKFGFSGELIPVQAGVERSAYVFTNDTHTLEVEVRDGSIYFYRKTLPKTGTLPTEEECIAIAEKWLKEYDLYPSNISRVKVGVKLLYDDKPVVMGVRYWTKIGEYPLENLGIYVSISYGGSIHEIMLTVYYVKHELNPYARFKLKTPIHALKILKAYLDSGFILPKGQTSNCHASDLGFGRLVVQDISLGYYGNPFTSYLQPIYIVRGKIDGREDFKGLVDAVDRSRVPSVLLLLVSYSIGHALAWDEGVAINDDFDGDFWSDAKGFVTFSAHYIIRARKGNEEAA